MLKDASENGLSVVSARGTGSSGASAREGDLDGNGLNDAAGSARFSDSDRKRFPGIVEILEKLDLPGIISKKTGLGWKTPVKIVHKKAQADWGGLDTVYVDLDRGIWAVSGVVHELVHLILRQNRWAEDPKINEFIEAHEKRGTLRDQGRGGGYPIEQMVAYLLQRDVQREIGNSNEDYKELLKGWDESYFSKILEREYHPGFLNRLGRVMIDKWGEKLENENVIDWIRSLISHFE